MRKLVAILLGAILTSNAIAATIIEDTEIGRTITELIAPLGTAANIPGGRMRVHIIHDDDFNAFVRGGEDIYIYTGLLTQVRSPDALQAVVAHELGHTLGGHMAQMSARMDAEMKRAMIIQALGVGMMVAGGNPSMGAGVLAGAGGIATNSMLAFSRDEERIADNMGLDLMIRAGQNPNGFIDVFEQMRDISGAAESRINPNRINHPLTDERLKNVREQISLRAPKYTPNKKQDDERRAKYDMVRAKLIGYLDRAERVMNLYPDQDKSDAAIYARAISRMRAGNLDTARVGTNTLIKRHPTNPYYYELLGDIEYRAGNLDASVVAYEHSLKFDGGNAPQIQTAYALVLNQRGHSGDNEKAIDLCRRALLREPSPLTYWVLAGAYNDGRSDWAMAEYYQMNGDNKHAREYAKRAQKNLSHDSPEYIKSGDILNSATRK